MQQKVTPLTLLPKLIQEHVPHQNWNNYAYREVAPDAVKR